MYSAKGFEDNKHLAETDEDRKILDASIEMERKNTEFLAQQRQEKQTLLQRSATDTDTEIDSDLNRQSDSDDLAGSDFHLTEEEMLENLRAENKGQIWRDFQEAVSSVSKPDLERLLWRHMEPYLFTVHAGEHSVQGSVENTIRDCIMYDCVPTSEVMTDKRRMEAAENKQKQDHEERESRWKSLFIEADLFARAGLDKLNREWIEKIHHEKKTHADFMRLMKTTCNSNPRHYLRKGKAICNEMLICQRIHERTIEEMHHDRSQQMLNYIEQSRYNKYMPM
jgi:hypothetical protein